MISLVNGYHVVLDACVLVPMPVCAVLLQLAQEPALFVPKWSEDILAEVARALAKPSFNLTPAQIDRRMNYMRTHFEEALVTGYENLIDAMKCHPEDRHVLAAAVRCEADAIVTNNSKDFPKPALEPYGIERLTVDEFLLHQLSLNDSLVREKLSELSEIRQFEGLMDRLSLIAPVFTKTMRSL
jgi:predicted nucleic acid-binding protein